MKKLLNLILLVTTSLIFLSCEKEKYPGAYPFKDVIFLSTSSVTYLQKARVINFDNVKGWNKEMYPMELWVDDEEIATISQDGYLTGKKLGGVTVYAKVMSVYGMIETSKKIKIGEDIMHLTKEELSYLYDKGIDSDDDKIITATELLGLRSIYKKYDYLPDTTFNKISPYIKSLDTLKIITYNQSLDLEHIEIKHLIITDGGFKWKENFYPISSDSIENEITYKTLIEPYVLKELKINKALEELTFNALPHFTTLDLREFRSLKRINRNFIYEWGLRQCNIIPPTSIEYINVVGVNMILEGIYNSLHTYRFECPIIPYTTISKDKAPNLKNLYYNFRASRYWETLDIRDYEITDFNSIYINGIDVLILKKSVYDSRLTNTLIANKYEIIE